MRLIPFFLLLIIPAPVSAQIEHWPQFRSPDGSGNVGNLQLPTKWSATAGTVWKVEIPGLGHASPVHDGRLCWLLTASRDGRKLGAVAVDLASGRLVHNVTVFEPANVDEIHHDNSYASPTPVLEQGRLYVHYGTYGTACLDASTGEVLWRNEGFPVEHQGGPGSSPLLHDDLLILTLDGADTQQLVALNAENGSVRWQRRRSAPLRSNPITHRAFSTPLLAQYQGRPLLISPGADQCHAYDPSTGDELWHVRYVGFSTVPRPVADETRVYFCTGFFQPELWGVTLGGTGDVTDSHVAWKFKGPVSETPSPLLADGRVHIVSNKGIATCVNAETGKREWVLRLGGNYSASPLFANGLIYICSEEGLTKVVDVREGKPRIIETNRLPGRIMASPAILGHDLLIRTDQALYRISERELGY